MTMKQAKPTPAQARLEPGMSGGMVAHTALFALAHGLEPATLERATGLTMSELAAPDARFDNAVLPAIWRCMLDAHPDTCLPLDLARVVPPDFLGPLAFGVHYAETLRAALDVMVRYRRILSDELEAGVELDGEFARCWFRHPYDDDDAGAAALVGLALGVRFVTELVAVPEALVGVELSHAPLGPPARYAEQLGVPARFETGRNAMILRADFLDVRPEHSSSTLFVYIEKRLDLAWERLRTKDDLFEVRAGIAALAKRSEYGAEPLAKHLGLSLRVLQRQVAAHETTVRQLIDEAREANARELLGDPRLSVDEVAFLLGYSNERAFRRSFKRTNGTTPAQFRRERRS